MQNEQSYLGEEGREKDAGEASLERSERSERSGSEASPARRPPREGTAFRCRKEFRAAARLRTSPRFQRR